MEFSLAALRAARCVYGLVFRAIQMLWFVFEKTVTSPLCTPNAFATCCPADANRLYHDAVVAELVDAQR
jgi:uncharacterized protein YqiB (DUF1249 family)